MEILTARTAGFCYGVEKALQKAREISRRREEGDPPPGIYTLGPIIHNRQVVEDLRGRFGVVSVESMEGLAPRSIVVIRTHGVGPETFRQAQELGLELIDATCPNVRHVQRLARKLVDEGYVTFVLGEPHHPEVNGILSHTEHRAQVVESAAEIRPRRKIAKAGLVVQTTLEQAKLDQAVCRLLPLCKELRVFNTICPATEKRQKEAETLSRKVQMMLVVGGRHSANTTHLANICRAAGAVTHHIESAGEIDPAWLAGIERVGISGGASTPRHLLEEVESRLRQLADAGPRP